METKNLLKSLKRRLSGMLCLVMFLAISQGAYSWGWKDGGSSWSCEQGFSNQTFYKTPGGSTISLDVKIKATSGGINVTQNDGCNGHTLYVGWSNGSSTDVVRATARWNGGLYSEYTVVIPKGKVYVTPYGGSKIEMTNNGSYAYTAKVSFPSTKTFTISGDAPTGVTIENQSSMPSAGKPSSVQLNYTGLSSSYSTAKIDYNLWTNQLTVTEVVTRTFAANEYIYLKNFKPSGWGDCWVAAGHYAGIKLTMFDGTTQYAWFDELYSGIDGAADAVYRAKITTAGECESFVITRNDKKSGDPTTSYWNKTSDCKFTSTSKTYNRITKVTENSSTWSGDVFSPCTDPTATQYSMTNATKTYGSVTAPTITPASGAGAVETIYYTGINGTTYTKSSTLPTNAGTYKVTVDVNAGDTYCAKDGIELTGNFVINKASRTISITNSTTTFCQTATPTVTSSVSAGGTDGTITYTKTGGTATATVNSSTGVITCTTPGTVIVKASISEGTNYEAAVSTTKTFTFDASTVAGQVYVTGTTSNTVSICSGGSTSLTSYNKTGSVVKWMYQEGVEVGTSTWHDIASSAVDTYTPQNLTQQTRYKVSVKNGTCGSGGSGYTTVNIASSEITQVLPAPTFEAVAIGSTGTAKNFQFTACGISINPSDLNITLYSDASHGGVDGRTQFQLGTPTLSAGVLTVPVSFKPTKNNTSGTNEWGAQIRLATKDESYIKKSAVFTAAVTCTAVTSSQYTLSGNSYTYDGTNKTVTVTPKTGAGAVSKIMYAGVEGGKTNAGTYAITINSALGDTYCAASGINVGNLTISKKAPVVGDFNITIPASREYDGTAKAATVVAKGGITGMGAVTVKYNGNTTVPTAAGTYNVTFDVAAGDNYSAENGLSAGTMKITKASRTITLDNTDLINCQTSPFALTSTVNKGSGDGAVTYQITGGTGVGSIAGSTLSCTTPGTVIVKAKVAEGTNYQYAESATKTFTFQPSSVGGTLAPATADVCYGGSQELTLSGQTGTIQKWQYSYDGTSWNDITSTDNPYNVENIQNNLQLRVVVKSGECAAANSAVSAITVKGAPISIAGSGAKSTSATYPWEYFNFTATTTATDVQITWNCVYSTSLEASKTVFEWSGKTAKLKSGAPASESAHYTVTAKTNVGGCELTSSGYDVYIYAAPAEDCGK